MILKRTKVIGKNILLQAVIFLCLILSLSLLWGKNNFGNIGFGEIIFHLNMPLKGTSSEFIGDYIKKHCVLLFCCFWQRWRSFIFLPNISTILCLK